MGRDKGPVCVFITAVPRLPYFRVSKACEVYFIALNFLILSRTRALKHRRKKMLLLGLSGAR